MRGAIIIIVVSLLFIHFTAAWLGVIVGAALLFKAIRYNKDVYPGLYSRWDRLYLCNRCGTMMNPTLDEPRLVQAPPTILGTIEQPKLADGER